MRAVLFKKENVYVVIKGQQVDYSNLPNDLIFDYNSSDRCCTCLYGGRVILTGKYNGWHLKIDGLELQHFWLSESNKLPYASDSLDPEMVSAYLNQMENLGVDSFLTNYKNQVQELKKVCNDEIEELKRELDVNYDEKKALRISHYRDFMMHLAFIIVMLMLNMNAGLENHCYTTAYNNIINLYF